MQNTSYILTYSYDEYYSYGILRCHPIQCGLPVNNSPTFLFNAKTPVTQKGSAFRYDSAKDSDTRTVADREFSSHRENILG